MVQIFLHLRGKDLRSCSCVCREWNTLISYCKPLNQRNNSLDPYEPIRLVHSFQVNASEERRFRYSFGVCCLGDIIFISDWDNLRIRAFNQNGEFVRMITWPSQWRQPGILDGICIHQENLWIVDVGNENIQVFNPLTGDLVQTISLEGYKPRHICSSGQGFVLAATEESTILVLNQKGSIINKFASHKVLGWTEGICCNSCNETIVSDSMNDRIQVFSQEGKLVRGFGSIGQGKNQFNGPRGICVDFWDNIFVSDRGNNRISIFDRVGSPLQQVSLSMVVDICLIGRKLVAITGDSTLNIFSN